MIKESEKYPGHFCFESVWTRGASNTTLCFPKRHLPSLREALLQATENIGNGVTIGWSGGEVKTSGFWSSSYIEINDEGMINASEARELIKDIEALAERETRIQEGLRKMREG